MDIYELKSIYKPLKRAEKDMHEVYIGLKKHKEIVTLESLKKIINPMF